MKHTKWPSALAFDYMNNAMMKLTNKWSNEQWNDETLEGLSEGVKHNKLPIELASDEINIHVKWGEELWRENVLVLMNLVTTSYDANVKN